MSSESVDRVEESRRTHARALITSCEHNACPTVWELEGDEDNVLVQGYRVTDASILGDIDIRDDELVAIVPRSLLRAASDTI